MSPLYGLFEAVGAFFFKHLAELAPLPGKSCAAHFSFGCQPHFVLVAAQFVLECCPGLAQPDAACGHHSGKSAFPPGTKGAESLAKAVEKLPLPGPGAGGNPVWLSLLCDVPAGRRHNQGTAGMGRYLCWCAGGGLWRSDLSGRKVQVVSHEHYERAAGLGRKPIKMIKTSIFLGKALAKAFFFVI